MSVFRKAVMTDLGMALLAKSVANGGQIEFVRLLTGSGTYTEEERSTESLMGKSALKEVQQEFGFSSITPKEDMICLKTLITNEELTSGYRMTEIGIIAREKGSVEDGILYSISVADEPDYIPDMHSPVEIIQEYYTKISNTDKVSFAIDMSSCALSEDLVKETERAKTAEQNLQNTIDNLHAVARSGSYGDLDDKPQIPVTGTCNTAKGTAEKTVDCLDFAPYDGARIMVTFTQGSSTNYMTLNVNGTGGAAVWFPVGDSRTYNNEAIAKFIAAGCAYEFIYQDGDMPKWVYCGIISTADTLGAVKKTGDTMTGKLEIYADADPYVEAQVNVTRGGRSGRLVVSASNKFGLYDATKSKWIVESGEDGAVKLHGNAATASDASRSDALQSFQSNGTPYPRGEYVIRSIYGEDQKFWLQCLNDNSDQTRYQVAVNWAGSAGVADKSQYLRTFSASGDGHGDAYLLKCQHNLYGDGYFGFAVEGHKIEVDHALAATRDGNGKNIADTYMPKTGGTFTGGIKVSRGGDVLHLGDYNGANCILTEHDSLFLDSNYGDYGGLELSSNEAIANRAFFGLLPRRPVSFSQTTCSLGDTNRKWDALYANNGTIQTSDKNHKTDIHNLDTDLAVKFIKGLIPSSYKMVDGQSGRTHYGLIAQDIEELMGGLGMSSTDFAGFIKSPKTREIREDENGGKLDKPIKEIIDGEFDYALRYDEFIAPIITFVQYLDDGISNLTKEIESLREKNTDLKKRLEALEKIIYTGGADGT